MIIHAYTTGHIELITCEQNNQQKKISIFHSLFL